MSQDRFQGRFLFLLSVAETPQQVFDRYLDILQQHGPDSPVEKAFWSDSGLTQHLTKAFAERLIGLRRIFEVKRAYPDFFAPSA